MAIENFEGKNIQDTFQRVVQTDGTNRLADGTGSIFIPVSSSHAITASHALFAVSASHEITLEVSSSHAETADALTPGIDINVRHITASGDISGSGDIFIGRIVANFPDTNVDALHYPLVTTAPDGTIQSQNSLRINPSTNTLSVSNTDFGNSADDTHTFIGNITSSGNISSSGQIIATSFDARNTSEGFLLQGAKILYTDGDGHHHIGNHNVPLALTGSSIEIGHAGDTGLHITASGNISASGNLTANEITASGGILTDGDIKFSSNTAKLIGTDTQEFIRLSDTDVDIFIAGSEVLNIDGDSINFNVSSQAINTVIKADDGSQLFFGDASNNVVRLNDHIIMSPGAPSDYTNRLFVSGSSKFIGNITASGDISASGELIGIINGGTF